VLGLLCDPGTRRRFGEAGREWVREVYSKERVLRMAVEFYRGLLEEGRRPGLDSRNHDAS